MSWIDEVKWQAVECEVMPDDDLPYVTHEGVLDLLGMEIKCYRLSTGQAVIDADSMHKLLGVTG